MKVDTRWSNTKRYQSKYNKCTYVHMTERKKKYTKRFVYKYHEANISIKRKEKGIKIIITQVMEQKSCHHIYIKAENQWDWLVKGKTFCQLNILSAILFLRKIW